MIAVTLLQWWEFDVIIVMLQARPCARALAFSCSISSGTQNIQSASPHPPPPKKVCPSSSIRMRSSRGT